MGIGDSLNRIERRYALPFIGFLLALIFGGITVYTEFFRDDSPKLEFDVIGNASVLDVREDLSGLQIIYDNLDIRRASMALRVMLIRVSNPGASGIQIGSFDPAAPVGLEFPNAKVLRVDVDSANSDYLRSRASFSIKGETTVQMSPVIIVPGEYIVIKCLLLHGSSYVPAAVALGKVAGVHQISVLDSSQAEVQESISHQAFGGTLKIQILRFLGYVAVGFGGLIFAAMLASIFGVVAQARRKRQVESFVAKNPSLAARLERIGSVYTLEGVSSLHAALGFVNLMRDPTESRDSDASTLSRAEVHGTAAFGLREKLRAHAFRAGVLVDHDGAGAVDHEQVRVLREFLEHLESGH